MTRELTMKDEALVLLNDYHQLSSKDLFKHLKEKRLVTKIASVYSLIQQLRKNDLVLHLGYQRWGLTTKGKLELQDILPRVVMHEQKGRDIAPLEPWKLPTSQVHPSSPQEKEKPVQHINQPDSSYWEDRLALEREQRFIEVAQLKKEVTRWQDLFVQLALAKTPSRKELDETEE